MKIAFASSNGLSVDRHFGLAETYSLWEIDQQHAECIGKVDNIDESGDQEDKIVARASALEGCALAYSMQIGGPAAAKLVARHIHPLKTVTEVPIAELVTKLQGILQGHPPPWLRKAMGIEPVRSLSTDYDDD